MGRRRRLWPARRRRAASGDGVVIILVVAALAIAAIGVYLLIAGAVALTGWLVTMALKTHAQHEAPRLVAATTPSAAPLPSQQFQMVAPVDPTVFEDRASLEASASRIFAAWARKLPKAPADPTDALRNLTLHRRLIGRLTTKLDGRRFGWRSAPYSGRERVIGSAIDITALDPYQPPADLRTRSSHITLCKSCRGDGRLDCTSCGGSARVTCTACHGAGKVAGVTANGAHRQLNCKTCKGKASLACHACSKGQIDCVACERSGRVEYWLELEGGPRDGDVQVEPDGEVTRAFAWGKDGAQASDDEILRDAHSVCTITRDRLLTVDDLPSLVSTEWRNAHWQGIQARLHPGERVVSQTFTFLEVPSIEISYGVGSEIQSVGLEGLRMLAPPTSIDHMFSARATSLNRLGWVVGAVPAAILGVYVARGSYFVNPATAGVVLCAALGAVSIYAVVWHSTLRRKARGWVVGTIILIAAATTLAIFAEPRVAAARHLIDEGQLSRAKDELNALGAPRNPNLAPLWADVHLKEALATSTCPAATEQLVNIPVGAAQRTKAQEHADALALASAEGALKSGQLDVASAALGCASAVTRSGASGRSIQATVSIGAARTCISSKDWSCVMARAKDASDLGAATDATALVTEAAAKIRVDVDASIAAARVERDVSRRLGFERTAADLWTTYLQTGAEPVQLTALKSQVTRDTQVLAQQEEAARVAREAEAKRQRDAAERAEKRRAAQEELQRQRDEAALRRSEPTGLLCCDGTLSPSCSCGGSHRGCCSHHQGVCGCQ